MLPAGIFLVPPPPSPLSEGVTDTFKPSLTPSETESHDMLGRLRGESFFRLKNIPSLSSLSLSPLDLHVSNTSM